MSSPIWFVETYRGSGRPTGRICRADHHYVPPQEGGIGWWVSEKCWHPDTDGIAITPEEEEEIFQRG